MLTQNNGIMAMGPRWLGVLAAAATGLADGVPIECTDAATAPGWPTYHVMNAVTRCATSDREDRISASTIFINPPHRLFT